MKIVDGYFYNKANTSDSKGRHDIDDPLIVIPLTNQEDMALMISILKVDDEGSHYHSLVFNPAQLDVHVLTDSVTGLLSNGKLYYVNVLGPNEDGTQAHCPSSSKQDSGYITQFLIYSSLYWRYRQIPLMVSP